MSKNTEKNVFYKTLEGFRHFLFPPSAVCSFCGGEFDGGSALEHSFTEYAEICSRCLCGLAMLKDCCQKCGSRSLSEICIRCKGHEFFFERAISVSDYDSFAIRLLFTLKNGGRYIARDMAVLMADRTHRELSGIDLVTCVPLTPRALKRRGYNQSELLARHCAEFLRLPYIATLVKTRDTVVQKTLSAPERLKNIRGAYSCVDGIRAEIKGKTVLLADDVTTTGVTLSECSSALLNAGAARVFGVTFAAASSVISGD